MLWSLKGGNGGDGGAGGAGGGSDLFGLLGSSSGSSSGGAAAGPANGGSTGPDGQPQPVRRRQTGGFFRSLTAGGRNGVANRRGDDVTYQQLLNDRPRDLRSRLWL